MSELREAIEAAVEQHSTGVESVGNSAEPAAVAPEVSEAAPDGGATEASTEPAETPAQAKARDEKGRFAEEKKAAKAEAVKAKQLITPSAVKPTAKTGVAVPKPGETAASLITTAAAPAPDALKAPASWKPAAREKWAAMPAEVQTEVTRREKEIASAMQEAAPSKQFQAAFREVVGPYEGMIRAAGSEPLKTIATFLQTGAALRSGIPSQRAAVVARIIQEYDVPIDVLDRHLAGLPQQGRGEGQGLPGGQGEYRDPRVDQLMSHLQQASQQRSAASTQKMQGEISSFASAHEFYDDVREDMADMLELAGKRGVALSLEDAYNRAVKLNPDVSAVFEQRKAAEAANAGNASTQRARAAASSVKSHPAGANGASQPEDLRGTIVAAMAAQRSR